MTLKYKRQNMNIHTIICSVYSINVNRQISYKQAEKKDNDRMTMKFLLHKDKEKKENATAQKQECGCPSLQPSLRSHTHAFLADTRKNMTKNKKSIF
jgi:hypothetical protein